MPAEVLALRSRLRQRAGHDRGRQRRRARTALQMVACLPVQRGGICQLQLGRARDRAAARFAQAVSSPSCSKAPTPIWPYLAIRVGTIAVLVHLQPRTGPEPSAGTRRCAMAPYAASRLAENDQSIDYFKPGHLPPRMKAGFAMTPQQQ